MDTTLDVERQRVDVGRIALTVTEFGNGPELVMLHGIGSRWTTWLPVIEQLATEFRLIMPDLRGHGDSDKPPGGYLLRDYAADLDGLLTSYGLTRPRILGHSLGGLIALVWATAQPDRALGIALEEPPLRSHPEAAARFDEWIALASMPVESVAAHYRRTYPDWSDDECRRRAVSITSTHPAVFTDLRDQSLGEPPEDRIASLAAIASPVLLVHGDVAAGGMVVPADAERFGAVVANARVVPIPGGSHSAHRDQTEAFLGAVLPFLRSL
jgi:pimeloyl-ACP methyl ester carboxylesterase